MFRYSFKKNIHPLKGGSGFRSGKKRPIRNRNTGAREFIPLYEIKIKTNEKMIMTVGGWSSLPSATPLCPTLISGSKCRTILFSAREMFRLYLL
jgi:hypothetical protein